MNGERVRLDLAGSVATVSLVHATRRNAIDPAFVRELVDVVARATAPGASRAILVRAEGSSFTVGGDLTHFRAAERLPQELEAMIEDFHEALVQLAEARVPVICAVQGAAAGGGLGLVWCADVVIAADDLKVATGFADIGLSGDGGSSWWLPRLVGMRRAQELVFGGRVLSAAEALDWGLVTRVVARAELDAEARRVAERFARGPTAAYAQMRRLLRSGWDVGLRDQLAAELAAMVQSGATGDGREGIAAFAEKRQPDFRGS